MSDEAGYEYFQNVEQILFPVSLRLPILIVLGLWLFIIQLKLLNQRLPNLSALLQFSAAPQQQLLPSYNGSKKVHSDLMTNHLLYIAKKLTKTLFISNSIIFALSGLVLWAFTTTADTASKFANSQDNKTPDIQKNTRSIDQVLSIPTMIISIATTAYVLKTLYANSTANIQKIIRKTLSRAQIESSTLNRLLYILLSDTLTSYSKPIVQFVQANFQIVVDPSYLTCIGLAPASIRCIQCLRERNYWNAFKYSLNYAIFFCHFNSYQNLQIATMFLQSIYTFWWDCTMDWGFGFMNFNHKSLLSVKGRFNKFSFLREKLTFHENYYFAIIVMDFVLRFLWLFPFAMSFFVGSIVHLPDFVQHFLEILRRWLWVFLRLEYEHWNMSIDTPL